MKTTTSQSPLPSRPRIYISSVQLVEDSSSSNTSLSSFDKQAGGKSASLAENIGRWTDEEHSVFLEGLGKHGKQWKLIAGMIGSRTVVQVRTHAQKYFHKMEKTGPKSSTSLTMSTVPTAVKRKSLPTTLSTRPKKAPRKASLPTRSSVVPKNPVPSRASSPLPLPPHEIPKVLESSNSSVENLSTISPNNVADFDLNYISVEGLDETLYLSEDAMDGGVTDEDPLEWLMMDPNMEHLPESSLDAPQFPELGCSVPDPLVNIADPKVTVQSLLSEDGQM